MGSNLYFNDIFELVSKKSNNDIIMNTFSEKLFFKELNYKDRSRIASAFSLIDFVFKTDPILSFNLFRLLVDRMSSFDKIEGPFARTIGRYCRQINEENKIFFTNLNKKLNYPITIMNLITVSWDNQQFDLVLAACETFDSQSSKITMTQIQKYTNLFSALSMNQIIQVLKHHKFPHKIPTQILLKELKMPRLVPLTYSEIYPNKKRNDIIELDRYQSKLLSVCDNHNFLLCCKDIYRYELKDFPSTLLNNFRNLALNYIDSSEQFKATLIDIYSAFNQDTIDTLLKRHCLGDFKTLQFFLENNIKPTKSMLVYLFKHFDIHENEPEFSHIIDTEFDFDMILELFINSNIVEDIPYWLSKGVKVDSALQSGRSVLGCANQEKFDYIMDNYEPLDFSPVYDKTTSRDYSALTNCIEIGLRNLETSNIKKIIHSYYRKTGKTINISVNITDDKKAGYTEIDRRTFQSGKQHITRIRYNDPLFDLFVEEISELGVNIIDYHITEETVLDYKNGTIDNPYKSETSSTFRRTIRFLL